MSPTIVNIDIKSPPDFRPKSGGSRAEISKVGRKSGGDFQSRAEISKLGRRLPVRAEFEVPQTQPGPVIRAGGVDQTQQDLAIWIIVASGPGALSPKYF